MLKNNGVYVGAWRDKNGKIRYLRRAGPEHVLCYAPTRSGKGVGLILPTLLSWQQSVFVTDLKGELYELTSGWRQKYAHNKILRFEPAAAAGSCCFNPMAELRLGTEHEVGDVQNLALLIVDPDGRGLKSGDHFQKTAYSLLVGCILHLCYKAKVQGTPATFGALDRMLADTRRPILELWNEMLTYAHINGQNHPVVSACARDMLDRPPNEAGSVLSTAKTFLDLYRDPTVAKNTSRSGSPPPRPRPGGRAEPRGWQPDRLRSDPRGAPSDHQPTTGASNTANGLAGSQDALSKLLARAEADVGVLSTSKDPGTDHGQLGCADAVTRILHDELGFSLPKTLLYRLSRPPRPCSHASAYRRRIRSFLEQS